MNKIKILITDDSVVVRQLLRKILTEEPDFEIIGTASNGKIALEKIHQKKTDVLILDMEMPEMTGLETIKAIKREAIKIKIIVFSALTEQGAQITLEALSLGAHDYITKPTNSKNISESIQYIKKNLVPKIHSLVNKISLSNATYVKKIDSQITKLTNAKKQKKIDLLVIGTSTGGPSALDTILSKLPKNFPIPILIVQHMPPFFTKFLAERLSSTCKIKVKEAAHEDILHPGGAWIAPGDYHMNVVQTQGDIKIMLHQKPPINFCRPAVDELFSSAASLYGEGILALILTGMGVDGLAGAKKIAQCGGKILVQDEETSIVWGMPSYIVKEGIAEKILPLKEISTEILTRIQLAQENKSQEFGALNE